MRPSGSAGRAVALAVLVVVSVLPAVTGAGSPTSSGRGSSTTGPTLGATTHADAGPAPLYATTFNETGLPNGVSWSVGLNGTSDGVVGGVTENATPGAMLYDPITGEVFVTVPALDNVSVFNATNDSVVATIPVGADPTALAFDPNWNYIYVANTRSDNVTVIDAGSDTVVESISVGTAPDAIAVAPGPDTVYVANGGTTGRSNVTLINGSSLVTVGSVKVGADPRGATYDPRNTLLYVANTGSGNLTIINTTRNRTVGWLRLGTGTEPLAPVVDALSDALYVPEASSSGGLVVVDPADRAIVATVAIGATMTGALFDGSNALVYVGLQSGGGARVVAPSSNEVLGSIPVPAGVSGLAANASSGQVYLASGSAHLVVVVNGSRADGGIGVSVARTTLTDTVSDGVGTITFEETSGRYSYSSSTTAAGYLSPAGNGVLNVTDVAQDRGVDFGLGFQIQLNESGLPNGAGWSAELYRVVSDGVNGTWAVPGGSTAALYDPENGQLYVLDPAAGTVAVLNASYGTPVATLRVGAGPSGVALDPTDDYLFVTNAGSGNVTVLDGWNDTHVGSIPVGPGPVGIAYDPIGETFFVADAPPSGDGNLTVVYGDSLTTGPSIPVGVSPDGLAYDPGDGLLFVANAGSANLTIVNASEARGVGSISLASGDVPAAPALDNATGELFVAEDDAAGGVALFDADSGALLATVATGSDPSGELYDAADGCLYAELPDPGRLQVISGTSRATLGTIPLGGAPGPLGLAPWDDELFAPDGALGAVLTINSSTPDGGAARVTPIAGDYDAVADGAGSVVFNEVNGSYLFTLYPPTGYAAAPSSGWVVLAGAAQFLPARFTALPYSLLTFLVTGGLPAGRTWTLVLDGTAYTTKGNTISFEEPAGSYAYLIYGPSGHEVVGLSPAGTLALAGLGGSGPTESFHFVRGPTYRVTVHERGLATGAEWCADVATLICSDRPTIASVPLSPGTYPYAISEVGGLTLTVTRGGRVAEPAGSVTLLRSGARFLATFFFAYPVTFEEVGLPTGTAWSVRIGAVEAGSTGRTLLVELGNGTHPFRVGKVPGYVRHPAASTLQVSGGPVLVVIDFVPVGGGAPARSPPPRG